MANIFLDTNFVFDLIARDKKKITILSGHDIYISPLSLYIYYYSENIKVPHKLTVKLLKRFGFISLSKSLLKKAMEGPTSDLEDNIQLHSALKAGCNYFLTSDKKLLKMRIFGKTKIVSKI